MALRGIQEYIARDVNNIAGVEDEGYIVSIEGNIFLYPPKKEPSNIIIIIIHIGLCVSSYYLTIEAAILSSHENESLWDVATVTKVGGV